jgi:mono/diheme cytochrome c family protein
MNFEYSGILMFEHSFHLLRSNIMKRTLKIMGGAIAIIALLIAGGAIFIQLRGIPSYPVEPLADYTVEVTPDRVAKGRKMALLLCMGCHGNEQTGFLTGKEMHDAPPEFGFAYAPNITQDPVHGIGEWTDAELMYFFRTGIKKDGVYAPPWMPKQPHLSDEDMASLIAFLRSEDRMVEARAVEDVPCEPSFLVKFLSHVAFKPLPMPSESIPDPDTTDLVALGKYLNITLDCFACHSADFKTIDPLNPELSEGYMGGGNILYDKSGREIRSSNLTPDPETGIGSWSSDQFVRTLKFGFKEDAPALRYPMLPYVYLSDREAEAIYAYLKTLPPTKNKVERNLGE